MTDPTRVPARRIVAFLIDGLLVSAATIALFFALGPTEQAVGADAADICAEASASRIHFCGTVGDTRYLLEGDKAVQYLIGSALVWLLYAGVFQGLVGATIGKLLLGLRVVTADGARAGVLRCMLRSLPFVIGVLTMGVGFIIACIVGLVMILAHARHQRVGDLLARTFVVRTRDAGRPVVPVSEAGPLTV